MSHDEPELPAPVARLLDSTSSPGTDPSFNGASSAVLVLLAGSTTQDLSVLLTERAHHLRSQPGQIALPGGMREPGDFGPSDTALREAREEVGLDPETVRVVRVSAPVSMQVRSVQVIPVIGWSASRPSLSISAAEVAAAQWIRLTGQGGLSDPACRATGLLSKRQVGPVFHAVGSPDYFIWGLTAKILDAVLSAAGLAAPWPTQRRIPVPAQRARSGTDNLRVAHTSVSHTDGLSDEVTGRRACG
ncbi:NUDIX hydrolase [Devriesea agamarum]|uniref:NUDIX hydrolase n=1 Tax=Devriesea agamarum TaxID=472569 RepID=UPI00071C481E|nr:CoA pyrophosphatase [Devriesea agamarum]